MNEEIRKRQIEMCSKYGAGNVDCVDEMKVGISLSVRGDGLPINAVRVTPDGDSSGWFIWAGDWSDSPEFFVPLHVAHLLEWCPAAIPFLQLPPGWRFQVAPGHEDAWFDSDVQIDLDTNLRS